MDPPVCWQYLSDTIRDCIPANGIYTTVLNGEGSKALIVVHLVSLGSVKEHTTFKLPYPQITVVWANSYVE